MKEAVICSGALGDGINLIVLSNNLYLNGKKVITFHNGNFDQLQAWFPHLPIKKFPPLEAIPTILDEFDHIYVSYDTVDVFIQSLIKQGKENWPKKIKVINPVISKAKSNKQPFFTDTYFTRKISFVDNIYNFCKNVLNLPLPTRACGICCPYPLINRKEKTRVLIHSFSAKKGRQWSRKKYIQLYIKLKNHGLNPCFVMTPREKKIWDMEVPLELNCFVGNSLDHLAQFIYESGYVIGNDSGIGHLASALKIPVLSISRSKRTATVWRPAWGSVNIVAPSNFVPNIKGFRFRDKHWQLFISVRRVFKKFMKITYKA